MHNVVFDTLEEYELKKDSIWKKTAEDDPLRLKYPSPNYVVLREEGEPIRYRDIIESTISATVENGSIAATDKDGAAVALPYTGKEGDKLTLEVTPDDGYTFAIWNDWKMQPKRDVFVDICDRTYKALCIKTGVLLAVTAENGTVEAKVDGVVTALPASVKKGASVELTFTPDEGYAFEAWKKGETAISAANPYTFVAKEDTTLSCEGVELPPAYLTLTGCTGNDVSICYDEGTMEWSDDAINWHTLTSEETVPTSSSTVYLRGSNVQGAVHSLHGNFTKVEGNVHALINYEDIVNDCVPTAQPCLLESIDWDGLFADNTSLQDASEFVLPYLEMYYDDDNYVGGYADMFLNCTALVRGPKEIPVLEVVDDGLNSMFCGCSSLIEAPILKATKVKGGGMSRMFYECISLTTAPELPATVLEGWSCYNSMFRRCTNLTTVPAVLPATTLDYQCYYCMFADCTNLTTAPELPATTLAESCYSSMFYNCTSLTTAPELPATVLANGCYSGMFSGCTSLTTAPELLSTMKVSPYYGSMFKNTSITSLKCHSLEYGSGTSNWLSGIYTTGTLHVPANSDETIYWREPSTWTVVRDL